MTCADRMRKMRARRREAGLCYNCEKPAADGYTVCEGHRLYNQNRFRTPESRASQAAWRRKRALKRVFGNEGGEAA